MTVTPFRAGGEEFRIGPGDAQPQVVEPRAFPAFTGTYTLLADISEFQPSLADDTYLRTFSKAIVIRAAYGDAHDDRAWYGGARRDALHKGGVKFLGIYQYLIAGHPGAVQADAMARIVGALRPGEVLVADFEEGARPMLADWRARMLAHGYPAAQLWTYSGLAFEEAHGVTAEWVAAYRAVEPSVRHRLWQFTSAFQVPGVGSCDCSVFHGTVDELAALAWHPAVTPPPAPAPQYPVPAALSQTVQPVTVHFGWQPGTPLSPHWRWQVVHWLNGKPGTEVAGAGGVVTAPHASAVVPGPGTYAWRVQAAGDSPFTGWRVFTA